MIPHRYLSHVRRNPLSRETSHLFYFYLIYCLSDKFWLDEIRWYGINIYYSLDECDPAHLHLKKREIKSYYYRRKVNAIIQVRTFPRSSEKNIRMDRSKFIWSVLLTCLTSTAQVNLGLYQVNTNHVVTKKITFLWRLRRLWRFSTISYVLLLTDTNDELNSCIIGFCFIKLVHAYYISLILY